MTSDLMRSATAGIVALLLLAGCGDKSDDPGAPGAVDELEVEVDVPSQDEANAAAEDAIDEANADDELEKLAAEIEKEEKGG